MATEELPQFTEARLWLKKKDRDLAIVIEKVGICTLAPEPMQSPFEALAKAIVYQQLHGKAAATIFGRVKALCKNDQIVTPEDILLIGVDQLRVAGCSRSKVAALTDLATKQKEGLIPSIDEMAQLSDDEMIERLCAVRGIGRWTVEMLLMFRLGRPDVVPATDYGIRKGFAQTYKLDDLPEPQEVIAHAERWRPYRTVASWYLWRCLDP